MDSLNIDQRNDIIKFIKTFVDDKPKKVMRTIGTITEAVKPVAKYDGDVLSKQSTEDMTKTIANRGKNIFSKNTKEKESL
jgi:hypothetical protein